MPGIREEERKYSIFHMPQSIDKEIMHVHCMTNMTTNWHKNSCPEGHQIYKLRTPFLGYYYYIISLSDLDAWE